MTFTAGAPVPDGSSWSLDGTVSARGRDVPIKLTVTVDPGTPTTVTARGVIDRRPLGMRAPRFMIGRFVPVDLAARFTAP